MPKTSSSSSLKEYEQLLSLSLDLIAVFDKERKFITVSESCFSILGYRPDELIGTDFIELIHPEDKKLTATETISINRGRSTSSFENRYIHKNGSIVYLQWSSVYDEVENKYLCIARDITVNKKAAELQTVENKINKALVDSTSNLIWSLDSEFKFTGFNNAFKRSREKDYGAVIKIGINTFDSINFPEEIKAQWTSIYEKVLNGETIEFEYDTSTIEKNPDNIKWHKIELNPIYNQGEIIGIIGNSADITDLKEASLELEKRNKLIETVVKEIPMGVAVNEISSGQTVFINKQFSEAYNWPTDELKNVDIFLDKIYPKENQLSKDTLKKISKDIKSGDKNRMIWENIAIIGHDGSTSYVNAKNIPIFEQDLMISTVQDNTEKYLNKLALEASNIEKKEILDSISDAFYTLDEDYNFIFLNKPCLELMEVDQSDLVGKNLFNVFPELKGSQLHTELNKVGENKTHSNFEFYFDISGKWYDERIYKTPTGFSVFFVNITVKKNFEIKLQKLNTILKEKNTELEQFAFIASHDLQEPLRIIASFMDLLKKQYSSKLDEEAIKYIDFAIDGSYRMKRIISDLLDYSRAGSTDEVNKILDCNMMIEGVLSYLEGTINEKNAKIICSKLPNIKCNPTAFRQVMINIISNALKYVPKGVVPEIVISYKESKKVHEFFIKDNGIGINEKHHDEIFIPFKRLHNRSEYEGTGIGLSICKKLIEKCGGNLSVASSEGNGTTFSFTVPK